MSVVNRLQELLDVAGINDEKTEEKVQAIDTQTPKKNGLTKFQFYQKSKQQKQQQKQPAVIQVNTIDEMCKQYSEIQPHLNDIQKSAVEMKALLPKLKAVAEEKKRVKLLKQVNQLSQSVSKSATTVRYLLKHLDPERQKNPDDFLSAPSETKNNQSWTMDLRHPSQIHSTKRSMWCNLHSSYTNKYISQMKKYQEVFKSVDDEIKQANTRRLILVVGDKLSAAQIDEISSNWSNPELQQQVFRDALVLDRVRETVNVIEQRHLDILNVERSTLQLYEFFRDLQTLVDLQQESMNIIQKNVEQAKHNVEKGEVELNDSEDYQKKSRKWTCAILICLIIVLIIVLLVLGLLTNSLRNA